MNHSGKDGLGGCAAGPSRYLSLSERQKKTRAEAAVTVVTTPRMIARRSQGCPAALRWATSTTRVLSHSSAPRTRTACTSRATQGCLSRSNPGRARQKITSGSIPALRKCAPSSKQERTTGSSLTAFMRTHFLEGVVASWGVFVSLGHGIGGLIFTYRTDSTSQVGWVEVRDPRWTNSPRQRRGSRASTHPTWFGVLRDVRPDCWIDGGPILSRLAAAARS